jgi:hypothetical protein
MPRRWPVPAGGSARSWNPRAHVRQVFEQPTAMRPKCQQPSRGSRPSCRWLGLFEQSGVRPKQVFQVHGINAEGMSSYAAK